MKKFLLALALAAATVAAFAYISLGRPYKGFSEPVLLEIPRGTNTASMAKLLAERGVVSQAWQFQVARLSRPGSALQAGEYRFAEPATVWTVYDRIRRGDVYLTELRIPEGYNIFEIAGAVAEAGLSTEAEFLRAARDPSLIRDLAPEATTLEGFLFPSTYHVPRRITARELCRMMTEQFRRQWQALAPRGPVLSTVTLASLVEKETGVAAERPLVAGVYANRLKQGIRLEADPTTIYAARLNGNWRGTIYRSDLDRQHPYNTCRPARSPILAAPPWPLRCAPPIRRTSFSSLSPTAPAATTSRQPWPTTTVPWRCTAAAGTPIEFATLQTERVAARARTEASGDGRAQGVAHSVGSGFRIVVAAVITGIRRRTVSGSSRC
jgi:UPF0755 protein